MAASAEDPETRRWWGVTDGMQESFVEGAKGSGGDVPWWMVSDVVLRYTVAAFTDEAFCRRLRRCSDLKESLDFCYFL